MILSFSLKVQDQRKLIKIFFPCLTGTRRLLRSNADVRSSHHPFTLQIKFKKRSAPVTEEISHFVKHCNKTRDKKVFSKDSAVCSASEPKTTTYSIYYHLPSHVSCFSIPPDLNISIQKSVHLAQPQAPSQPVTSHQPLCDSAAGCRTRGAKEGGGR